MTSFPNDIPEQSYFVYSLPSTNAFGSTQAFFLLRNTNVAFCGIICYHSGHCRNGNCSEKALVPFFFSSSEGDYSSAPVMLP